MREVGVGGKGAQPMGDLTFFGPIESILKEVYMEGWDYQGSLNDAPNQPRRVPCLSLRICQGLGITLATHIQFYIIFHNLTIQGTPCGHRSGHGHLGKK